MIRVLSVADRKLLAKLVEPEIAEG